MVKQNSAEITLFFIMMAVLISTYNAILLYAVWVITLWLFSASVCGFISYRLKNNKKIKLVYAVKIKPYMFILLFTYSFLCAIIITEYLKTIDLLMFYMLGISLLFTVLFYVFLIKNYKFNTIELRIARISIAAFFSSLICLFVIMVNDFNLIKSYLLLWLISNYIITINFLISTHCIGKIR
jgi:hypothetical protein